MLYVNMAHTGMVNVPQILNSHSTGNGKLCDHCDGEQYLNHPLFTEDSCALQIEIYYDDIETVNALGSRTKVHKLGLTYLYFIYL